MMRRPSPVDYVVGNPLVVVGVGCLEIYLLILYFAGDEQQLLACILLGAACMWCNAAYQRIAAKQRDNEEWRIMHGEAPRPGPWGSLPRWLRVMVSWPLLAAALWLGLNFAAGMAGRTIALPDIAFGRAAADAMNAVEPYAGAFMLAFWLLLCGVILLRFRRRQSATRAAAAGRGTGKAWDGTVQVILPIPKE